MLRARIAARRSNCVRLARHDGIANPTRRCRVGRGLLLRDWERPKHSSSPITMREHSYASAPRSGRTQESCNEKAHSRSVCPGTFDAGWYSAFRTWFGRRCVCRKQRAGQCGTISLWDGRAFEGSSASATNVSLLPSHHTAITTDRHTAKAGTAFTDTTSERIVVPKNAHLADSSYGKDGERERGLAEIGRTGAGAVFVVWSRRLSTWPDHAAIRPTPAGMNGPHLARVQRNSECTLSCVRSWVLNYRPTASLRAE